MGPGPAGIPLIEYLFSRLVCIAVPLGYTALLVILVIAGIKYLTSGGETKAVQQAHQTVTWGLLGVLFLAISWLILQLIQNFTGIEVTKFTLASFPGVQGFTGSCRESPPVPPNPTPVPISQQQTPKQAPNVTQKQTTARSVSPTCDGEDKYQSALDKGRWNYEMTIQDVLLAKQTVLENKYCRALEDHEPFIACMVPCNQVEFYLVKTNIRTNILTYDIKLRSNYQTRRNFKQLLQKFESQFGPSQAINTMEGAMSDVIWVGGGCPETNEALSKGTFEGVTGDTLRLARETLSLEGGPWAKFPKGTLPLKYIEASRQRNKFATFAQNLIPQTIEYYTSLSPVISGLSCQDGDYYGINVIGP